jgi:hypothetical protein
VFAQLQHASVVIARPAPRTNDPGDNIIINDDATCFRGSSRSRARSSSAAEKSQAGWVHSATGTPEHQRGSEGEGHRGTISLPGAGMVVIEGGGYLNRFMPHFSERDQAGSDVCHALESSAQAVIA